ncbi:F0F1 ATP synthase subunit A [Candidatus Poribacteria bacterium]|nr:F0F1 ATP synthase subunit A [Candidatus Poribacteria bacterium]
MPEPHQEVLELAQAGHEEHTEEAAHASEVPADAQDAVPAEAHEVVAEHGGHHAEPSGRSVTHPPELPHFVQIWWEHEDLGTGKPGDLTTAQTLHVGRLDKPFPFLDYAPWENNVYAAIAALIVIAFAWSMTRSFRANRAGAMRRPTRGQCLAEAIAGATDNFCQGVLGPENGRRYMPYVAGLFFFILTMNLMGMVPLMKAPTSSLLITGSLSLCTFIYYVFTGVTRLGPVAMLKHLCGSPESLIQWFFAPLIFIIELISFFFSKPVSLALRLFGNILGKDILFGVALGLGMMLTSGIPVLGHWIGFPLTYPFYFLGLLLSAIQALVFALLSAIYILLVLPHDHDHAHEAH